jgi:hypothetical protein
MIRPSALIALAAVALTGCGSLGTTTAAGAPSSAPSSEPSVAASSGPCTTKACIVADAESLKGTVAKDNSVMTKVTCKQSTVRQVVPGTYTVHCTVSYSDGAKWRGIASVLTAKGDVEWEPTSVVSYGGG